MPCYNMSLLALIVGRLNEVYVSATVISSKLNLAIAFHLAFER